MSKFRDNSVYLSGEVYQFLLILAKAACNGTDANMTADELADSMLRNQITTDHPELVVLNEELNKEKQKARANYVDIESRMIAACLSPMAVSSPVRFKAEADEL